MDAHPTGTLTKLTVKRLKFPEQITKNINPKQIDEDYFKQVNESLKQLMDEDPHPVYLTKDLPQNAEELLYKMSRTERAHIVGSDFAVDDAVDMLAGRHLNIADPLTFGALLKLCAIPQVSLDSFHCLLPPFALNKGDKLQTKLLFPTKVSRIGDQYTYKPQYRDFSKPIWLSFVETFVVVDD